MNAKCLNKSKDCQQRSICYTTIGVESNTLKSVVEAYSPIYKVDIKKKGIVVRFKNR